MATKKRPQCKAKTKKGTRCSRPPMKGGDCCIAHAKRTEKESRGFGGRQEGSGPKPKPRVVDLVRDRVEAEFEEWYAVLVEARTATRGVVVGQGEHAEVQFVPDHPTRLRAFAEAMDRAYGKPTQATEVTGADGGPVVLEADAKGVELAHELLRRVRPEE